MPVPEDIQVHVLDMEINGGCNYKCQMCPQSVGREKDFLKKLPIPMFEKIVDDAMQYGLKTVTLHGSGEPTLNKNFHEYVRLTKERGLQSISFTNGKLLTEKRSEELLKAGIDILRLSCIGYDEPTYEEWMAGGDYDLVRENAKRFCTMAKGTSSEMHINHLIIDQGEMEYEVRKYRENWGQFTGAFSEIWLMHNWADSDKIDINYHRKGEKRSCGRPFAPLLQVRAGGNGGRRAAVVACCMVLGQDSRGVVGHLDTDSIADVIQDPRYVELRAAHSEGRFDDVEVCRNCDQLYDAPEALVWSDIPGRKYEQSKNLTTLNFGDYHES